MKKFGRSGLAAIPILLMLTCSPPEPLHLLKTTRLPHYPSASSLEFYKDRLYVIGDDARQVLILNTEHRVVDSLLLFAGDSRRLSKDEKPDLESTIRLDAGGKHYLVAFGSLSLPQRNRQVWVDLDDRSVRERTYSLQHSAIKEWNIEGSALVGRNLLLCNRANGSNPQNQLLIAPFDGERGMDIDRLRLVTVDLPKQDFVMGLSSIYYEAGLDMLFFSASTEHTNSAYADGSIGNSFVGYISDVSKKLMETTVRPNRILNVSGLLNGSGPQKIESLVVESHKNNSAIIHLASDNDDGQSTLFRLSWRIRD